MFQFMTKDYETISRACPGTDQGRSQGRCQDSKSSVLMVLVTVRGTTCVDLHGVTNLDIG